jgi:hypothetical protein
VVRFLPSRFWVGICVTSGPEMKPKNEGSRTCKTHQNVNRLEQQIKAKEQHPGQDCHRSILTDWEIAF